MAKDCLEVNAIGKILKDGRKQDYRLLKDGEIARGCESRLAEG